MSLIHTLKGGGATGVTSLTPLDTSIALTGTPTDPIIAVGIAAARLLPAIMTGAGTAAAGSFNVCDSTTGSFAPLLPAAPADKTQVGFKHVVQAGTNVVTITCGGSDVINRAGGPTTYPLSVLSQGVILQYKASTAIWYAVAADLPLGQLDLRYAAIGSSSSFYGNIFGDGSDGAATLDGTATVAWATKSGSVYTMTRDCLTTSLTINSGVTLNTAGFRLFCTGTVTNAGTIQANGGAGNANGGAGTTPGSGTLAGNAGGVGNVGAGSGGPIAGSRLGMAPGGAGGLGSGGAGGSTGFSGSTATSMLRNPQIFATGAIGWSGAASALGGGPGGGGGGGDTTNKGGGGGAGGGVVGIAARAVVNTGTLSAVGGAGGTPTTGNCGGGGGGAGGLILAYTLSAWTAGTTVVTGGAAGTGVGTGAVGVAGGNGSALNFVVA